MARDPHVAIMRAAKRGTGLRLTAAEVKYLSKDGAIETRAAFVADERAAKTRTFAMVPNRKSHEKKP